MQTLVLNGERYFVIFIDEMSGRVSISLLKSKDRVLTAVQLYRSRAEKSSGKEIKTLPNDGGGEYLNGEFKKYLSEAGIQHVVSPPFTRFTEWTCREDESQDNGKCTINFGGLAVGKGVLGICCPYRWTCPQ